MLKLGLQFKEDNGILNITLIDPTKKQLSEATESEKVTAQIFKEVFDKELVDMLTRHKDTKVIEETEE